MMNGLDLFTMPSWGESFPTAVGEAMSCGVPCVVTAVGEAENLIGITGWAVRPGDSKALSLAWEECYKLDSDTRFNMGVKARQRIKDGFSLREVNSQYEKHYLQLLNV